MSARYAIYYAPPAGSALWREASAWLGRDAATGQEVARPGVAGLEDLDVAVLTADPRHYGFHATLKAPFELAEGRTETELLAAASEFAVGLQAFEARIAPAALGPFLAFRLQDGEAEMQALHAACVRGFEAFRAPLGEADLARRRRARLTPDQDSRLVAWGYPYIFEDFRFHMTLTGSIADEALRARVLAALQDHFAAASGPHRFDGVAVFRQTDRQTPFDVVERFPFLAAVAA
jgi:putative phosphonate metabolism protein